MKLLHWFLIQLYVLACWWLALLSVLHYHAPCNTGLYCTSHFLVHPNSAWFQKSLRSTTTVSTATKSSSHYPRNSTHTPQPNSCSSLNYLQLMQKFPRSKDLLGCVPFSHYILHSLHWSWNTHLVSRLIQPDSYVMARFRVTRSGLSEKLDK